jgi:hypothetical protein
MPNRIVGTKQSKEYIKKLIVEEARRQGVPEYLALAVAAHESGFNNVAVSLKNTDGSRDHGVFQLNDRYHKLKDVYNPIENIRYGIGILKAGLKKNNGDVAKTLSDYNAGSNAKGKAREQGNKYAQKVMNLFPSYGGNVVNKIAQSSPQPTAQINKQGDLVGDTRTLEGRVSMEGMPTGAAANPLEGIDTGYTSEQLAQMGLNPLSVAALQNNLQNQYLQYSRDLTPTEQQILNRQVALDPATIMQADQQRNQAILQAQQNLGGQNQGMLDMINKAYADYISNLQNDYRLQNTGYSVDPKDIKVSNNARIGMALAGGDPNVLPSAEQQALQQYQAQIANQYGIPYEQYMAAMADIQAKQQAAQLQQIQDYITFAKNNGATDQEVIKQLGGSDIAKQLVENAKIQGSYSQAVAAPYMTQTGQLRQTGLMGQNQIVSGVPINAVDLAKAQIAAAEAVRRQQMANELGRYQTDINASTTMRGQDIGQQNVMIQQPARDINAAANFYGMTSPVAGYDQPGQQAAIINTLPANQRNVIVNPQLNAAQFSQAVTPVQGGGQPIQTTNPLSFQNLLTRFQRPQE